MRVAEQTEIVSAIRAWVDAEVIPSASELEHADAFPETLVEQMKELGLFGVIIPEEYGGLGLDLTTYVLIQIELSRGWMSLSGVLNTHFLAAWMIQQYGTDDQRQRYLPRMAKGEVRSAYSMTEPHAGSDVQAIRTSAVRDGDDYVITGQKMWATNGLRAGLVMLLAKTDPDADPPHRGMTAFVLEKEPGASEQPGLTIPPPLKKLGYKGVESTELVFDGFRTPASSVLGGEAGVGARIQVLHGRDRARPRQHRGSRRRHCNARVRGGHRLCAGARGVRQADRGAPGHSAQARPDGDEDRGRPPAHDAGRRAERRRRPRRPRSRDGKALCNRDGSRGLSRGDAHPRRLRLLAGVRRRASLPRRPAAHPREGSNEIQQLVIARRLLELHARG